MPCLLLVLVLAFPRVVMVVMFLSGTYLQRAYHGILLPALGFVFLPLTTVVYAWLTNTHREMTGINALILVAAVVIDAGGLGGSAWHRRRD